MQPHTKPKCHETENILCAGTSGVAMVVRAVTHHLGLLVQQPLLSAMRPLLQNFPQLLLQAAHSCSAETAAGLFGQLQYQVKQVCTPAPTPTPPCLTCPLPPLDLQLIS